MTNLQITLSAPDVGYAVWDQQPTTALRLSVMCNDKVVVSNRQLLRDAVPLALFPLLGGRAALVFDQYGHGTPFLEYAVLSATGRMGGIARIAHPGTRDTAATQLSVNPRGELIASWVHDDLAAAPESSPTSPGLVTADYEIVRPAPTVEVIVEQVADLGVARNTRVGVTVVWRVVNPKSKHRIVVNEPPAAAGALVVLASGCARTGLAAAKPPTVSAIIAIAARLAMRAARLGDPARVPLAPSTAKLLSESVK